ncbi:ATP-binding protein [Amycolatopsis umgeniensis]|uniref:DNA topoisomerase (ATP-hydrolyzing) n=1 Tax=Amycolatopsis umgeniensis TaxID=336628 RepID=A0A841AQB0_9PSEU|nr:ATP-binding protein [Amycolatopsis umgeniensis]MBB5850999.1 DNA gyrase subunit B [Amycolatopsis umgeniensis]
MGASEVPRRNTTHDWAAAGDAGHLARIRRNPTEFAPGGVVHLILEVLAYAAEEAESNAGGRSTLTLHPDGSVTVADNGRGTNTRVDDQGQAVKKPIMATKDLRFFVFPDAQLLPDGHPRRGMSVVAALSEWLVHTNRRHNGSWTQRYEHGTPVTDLTPVTDDGTTGTTVHFRPQQDLRTTDRLSAGALERWTESWPQLSTETLDRRIG